MTYDWSKMFLFLVLSLVVFVMVSDKRRPLANAPIDGGTIDTSQTGEDRSLISRGPGWANVASNGAIPPIALMMPRQGVTPVDGDDGI